MSQSTVLITGGSGFIGRHVVTRLLQAGEKVVLLTRPSSTLPDAVADQVCRVNCADWSLENLKVVLRNHEFTLLYHLASYGVAPGNRDIATMIDINASLPADLVMLAAERNAGVVMTGSCFEYLKPMQNIPLTENTALETGKLYGSSKAAGGLLASAIAQCLNVNLRLLRVFNVYGPGEPAFRLLPSLWRNLRQGQRVSLSAGSQIRDFVNVNDVVEAVLQAGGSALAGSPGDRVAIWNVCTGKGTTVRKFAELVASIMGVSRELLGFGDFPMRDDEIPWLVGSPEKIHAELHWKAELDVEMGLRNALDSIS